MCPFDQNEKALRNLAGKVAVMSGGYEGVAYATIRLLHDSGAHVVFGEPATDDTAAFLDEFEQSSTRIDFIETDIREYQDVVRLFRRAFEIHGRIDHAIACSSASGEAQLLLKDLNIDNIEIQPDIQPIEINLIGAIYFTRIALAYLKHENTDMTDRSLTLISSTIIFSGTSYAPLFQVSKNATLQLMRALRPLPSTLTKSPIRINTVCSSVTASRAMDPLLVQTCRNEGMILNEPEDIARVISLVCAQPEISGRNGNIRQLHGCAIACCGTEGWEFEEELQQSIENCLGGQAWEVICKVRRLFKRLNLPIWGGLDD